MIRVRFGSWFFTAATAAPLAAITLWLAALPEHTLLTVVAGMTTLCLVLRQANR